jgi:hypothetical protein
MFLFDRDNSKRSFCTESKKIGNMKNYCFINLAFKITKEERLVDVLKGLVKCKRKEKTEKNKKKIKQEKETF